MKEEIEETQGFLRYISDLIHNFVRDNAHPDLVLTLQIFLKLILFAIVVIVISTAFRLLFRLIRLLFAKNLGNTSVFKALYNSKVPDTVANFLSLGISQQLVESIMGRHPNSHTFLERTFSVLMIYLAYILYKRILKAVEEYFVLKQDFYRVTAIRAVTQTLNIFGLFFFGFLAISNVFGVSASTIWGSLTAMTAVLLLVFRDTILGFVTGIHVSTSRIVKVGDWVGIPKYNLEGTIEDISLLTTRIQNFDKTVSTIPTYDLVSTEIKNLQVMSESNTRRIKRSIIFNINSFRFVDEELFEKMAKINLVNDYLEGKRNEIIEERGSLQNPEVILNGKQLTNIGVFRIYAENYLKNNAHIDQSNTLMVRQLENTPQGMPLEIYAFTNDSVWKNYESIQSDIFDHLLVASQYFELEVMQFVKIE